MAVLLQDLRFAARMLIKSPGFTLVAVITMALGIGANTAIFSIIYGVLLRPLPFKDSSRLVAIWETNPHASVKRESTSVPNFLDWRERSRSFEAMVASAAFIRTLSGTGDPEQIMTGAVGPGFFAFLGVEPVLGRGFSDEDYRADRSRVALISSALWERRFGRDPAVAGRKIRLNSELYTIVGVLPASYRHPEWRGLPSAPEIWFPMALTPNPNQRRGDFLAVMARLRAGVSFEQARADMTAITEQLAREYPGANAAWRAEVAPLQEVLVGEAKRPLWLLLGAVGLLLLIACANVANLLLARSGLRRREFALRAALGGTQTRLFRQSITESLLLSAMGAALGLLIAAFVLDAVPALAGASIPRVQEIAIDANVLLFTFLLACMTGILFGCFPALEASRGALSESLKSGGRTAGAPTRRANRVRSLVIASEIALTLVLLVGAGLLMRSFWRIQSVRLGFEPAGVVTAEVMLPEGPRSAVFLNELLDRLERLPGVQAAGATASVPLSGRGEPELAFRIVGRPDPPPDVAQNAVILVASPGYFRAMNIALLRGRMFDERDRAGAADVALINDALARRHFRNENPIGMRLKSVVGLVEIVGVIGDVRQGNVTAEPKPQVYLAHAQRPWPMMVLAVRGQNEPASLAAAIRSEMRGMDPTKPVSKVRTAREIYNESLSQRRFALLLLGIFAGLALMLAVVGIYGVISCVVTQRTQEFGVRIALGAGRREVLGLVLRYALGIAAVGVGAGVVSALALTRLLSTFLYGVAHTDSLTFLTVVVFFLAVAALAGYLPARRATRIDPIKALRYE